MAHPLRIGLKLSQQVHPIDAQREAWRMADDAGFDHIWPFDHLIALGNDPTRLIFDGWTVLGALAENTKRARIGLNVTGNLYRHPGLLAQRLRRSDQPGSPPRVAALRENAREQLDHVDG